MDEEFIKDAICNLKRLERVIAELGYRDWRAEKSDLLNQEFSFSATDKKTRERFGGRIDVLATLNGRTRLAIVEVKEMASKWNLEQLFWYVDHRDELGCADPKNLANVEPEKTIGILMAGEFVPGAYDMGGRSIHLVRFRFDGTRFPFEIPARVPCADGDDRLPAVYKGSQLNTMESYEDRLTDPLLHAAFQELRRLCLGQDDPRVAWIVENPKGDYVKIRYKGEEILYIPFRTSSFDVGYHRTDGTWVYRKVDIANAVALLQQAKEDCQAMLALIDERDEARGVPKGFDWRLCDARSIS